GLPREYRSDLSILERGKHILSAPVRVNHPFQYKGLKFYQANYGMAGESYALIAVRNSATGEEAILKTGIMGKTPLPGSESCLVIGKFNSDHQGHGPAVLGALIEQGEPHRIFWISKDGVIEESEKGDFDFRLKDFKRQYYTGLRITKNPGAPLIWIGFMLFFSGFIINFFAVHERIWVRISHLKEGCEINIASSTSKRKEAFREKLDMLLGKLDRGN
ncbi:MAG: cytochrome c biogenesis protein ResB, partial [Deltaproteobacteria bacterium]|nr:cytochrome c biogenesis protein ResB [Deltaproteobacteria bacterium]